LISSILFALILCLEAAKKTLTVKASFSSFQNDIPYQSDLRNFERELKR